MFLINKFKSSLMQCPLYPGILDSEVWLLTMGVEGGVNGGIFYRLVIASN